MRLRIRPLKGGQTLRIRVAEDNSTLQSLKEAVASTLSQDISRIFLSLNKMDAIHGEDDTPLQTLGITGGDLIFYDFSSNSSSDSESFQMPKRNREDGQNSTNVDAAAAKKFFKETGQEEDLDDQMPKRNREDGQNSTNVDAAAAKNIFKETGQEEDLDDHKFNLPSHLVRVFAAAAKDVAKFWQEFEIHDLLLMAVDAAMLESGFIGFPGSEGIGSHGWNLKAIVRLNYTIPELIKRGDKDEVIYVTLITHKVGEFVVFYGYLKGFSDKYRLELSVSEFGSVLKHAVDFFLSSYSGGGQNQTDTNSFYEKLYSLWRILKDQMALPLHIDLCQVTGLNPPPSLMMLPYDLKSMFLAKLPGLDLAKMACSSTEFKFMCDNDELWKERYQREFSCEDMHGIFKKWKDAFAFSWRLRNERRRYDERPPALKNRRPIVPFYPYNFGGQGNILPFGRRQIPGILGGDYDLLPGVLPDSLGALQGLPGIPQGRFAGPGRRSMSPFCNLGGPRI